MSKERMYRNTKTWNPFVGCEFDCTYCVPTFKAQAKRQRKNCQRCYEYLAHTHSARLGKIPAAPVVFVCGSADLAWCDDAFKLEIIMAIRARNGRQLRQGRNWPTYYLQSKAPQCFEPLLPYLPQNVILVTTLETNLDAGYELISKAPPPTERARQFAALDWPRKVVTIEPLLDFDDLAFPSMIRDIKPEYVWLGLNSHPKRVELPEPPPWRVSQLVADLEHMGIVVRRKDLRGYA